MRLSYTEPFDWHKLLGFFAGRATPGVESVSNNRYRRTLRIDGRHQIVEIAPDPGGGSLLIRTSDSSANPELTETARCVFDLNAPIDQITGCLGQDRLLKQVLKQNPGVRLPGSWDGFELTVRAILGQQISVKAATTIAGRIAARYGGQLRIEGDPDSQLNRLFPTPDRLARARFNNIGLVRSRATTIRSVATATIRGDLRFDGSQSPDKVRAALMSIKGIGDWTAQYVSMRALKDPDAFPGSDLGLISALAHPQRVTPKELTARAEHWRPWRAYAAMLLWGSLPGSGG
jgi:AraC family transcriptional regulator of adaptative response / DNA-3-methyladenine glycosylase II